MSGFVRAFIPFNPLPHNPKKTLTLRIFEIIVGKAASAGDQHFLLFPRCFLSDHNTPEDHNEKMRVY